MKYLRNKIIKYKKLLLAVVITLAAAIGGLIFFIKKIEAPVIYNVENSVKGTTVTNPNTTEVAAPQAPVIPREKYKIVSRSVVVPEDPKNKNKVVLLTIDDGPSARTMEMINILKKHNAKAIFFINGMYDKNNKGVLALVEQEGFTVGNHTWSHMNLKRQKDFSLSKKEIDRNSNLIKDSTGKYPRFFRAPYGESNPEIRKYIKDNGMIFMDWSGAAMDWNKSTEEKDVFVGNVMKNLHSGSIILIHEHPWSLANLDALLVKMETEGYSYVDPNDIVE